MKRTSLTCGLLKGLVGGIVFTIKKMSVRSLGSWLATETKTLHSSFKQKHYIPRSCFGPTNRNGNAPTDKENEDSDPFFRREMPNCEEHHLSNKIECV